MTALLDTREAAAYLNVAPKTLRNWRTLAKGPVARKLPGSTAVRYRLEDLDRFVDAGAQLGTPAPFVRRRRSAA